MKHFCTQSNAAAFCLRFTRGGLLALLLAAGAYTTAAAQEMTVRGNVSEDDFGLPGVNVSIKGTSTGTVTDVQGNYTLQVPSPEAVLVYSFVGYLSQEVPVNGRATIDVNLAPDVQQLSEVVVVGYGTQRKEDVTGAIERVNAADFNPGINPNPLQAIQGKVAGLTITQGSGNPNAAPTVRLRGYTSLAGGSDPLYVVDGIIGVPINSVAPEDIASIDVLKDASAAAIYGSRAANGVIIITTKRGKEGTTQIGFNNYIGVETISNRLDLLDAEGYRAQVFRRWGEDGFADASYFPTDANGNGYNTDWVKEISRVAFTNNHDLSFMGGSENFSYRASANFINREGVIKNSGFQRLTARVNLDQRALNDKLRIQYNLSVTNTDAKLGDDGVMVNATLFLPTLPARRPDGAYYEVDGFNLFNPVAQLENFQRDEVKRVLIGGVDLKYEVFNGFTLGMNGALRNENKVYSEAFNPAVKAYQTSNGQAGRYLEQIDNRLLELTALYQRAIGANSSFDLLGGYSYQENINDGFGATNNQFVPGTYNTFGYNNLNAGRGTLVGGNFVNSYKNDFKLISFFGRANVNLLDRYNLTATLRRDGSTKFGGDEKWGLFPSIAANWILSNEDFLAGSGAVNSLILRAGWGQTGNSEGISPYRSLPLYGQQGNYYDGALDIFVPGYAITQNPNSNLKWEILEQANVGVDFLLFNRLSGTLDLYNKITRDMLYIYNVSSAGSDELPASTLLANVGSMRNRGIELSLGMDVIKGNDAVWNVRFVGSALENEIVSLQSSDANIETPQVVYNAFGGRGLSNVFASELRQGRPYGEFLIPRFAGFADNGDMLLEGADGQPTASYNRDLLYGAGVALPRYTASIINTVRYGNFDLNFQLRGIFGHKILNNLRSNLSIPGSILETNMLTDVARLPVNFGTNQISDFWLEDASFVRLDNWQIGYNVPMVTGKLITRARVYVGGNNLFVLTRYRGIDPELEVRGDLSDNGNSQRPNNVGIDATGIYPKTRSFQLGVNLTF